MNLAELQAQFSQFVAAVRDRIRKGGYDPDDVLDVRGPQFRLRAKTVEQTTPLWYDVEVREVLQTTDSVDKLADTFVENWEKQRRIDGSWPTSRDTRPRP